MGAKVGHIVSQETRDKLRNAFKGRKLTDAWKEKIKAKSIFCTDNNPKLGKGYLQAGEKHWNWKNGRSGLIRRIRSSRKLAAWRKFIYERDEYQCVKCGCNDVALLEAHHIEELSLIITNLLNQYPSLSPLENVSELYALAMKYEPFWDTNNGITVCVSCHKKIPHKWGRYTMKEA